MKFNFFCPPSYEKKNLVYCSSLNNSILHRFLIRHLLDLKTVNFGSTPFGFSKKSSKLCSDGLLYRCVKSHGDNRNKSVAN